MSLYYRAFVCLLWETAVGLILLLIHPQTPSSTLNSHSTICQIRKMLPTNCYTLPAWASMAAYICSITMNRSCGSPIIVRLLFLCAVACIAMYGKCARLSKTVVRCIETLGMQLTVLDYRRGHIFQIVPGGL